MRAFIKTPSQLGCMSYFLWWTSGFTVSPWAQWSMNKTPSVIQSFLLLHNLFVCVCLSVWSLAQCGMCPVTIRPCICAFVTHAKLYLSHESWVHAYMCVFVRLSVCHQVTGAVSGLLFVLVDNFRQTATETFNRGGQMLCATFSTQRQTVSQTQALYYRVNFVQMNLKPEDKLVCRGQRSRRLWSPMRFCCRKENLRNTLTEV